MKVQAKGDTTGKITVDIQDGEPLSSIVNFTGDGATLIAFLKSFDKDGQFGREDFKCFFSLHWENGKLNPASAISSIEQRLSSAGSFNMADIQNMLQKFADSPQISNIDVFVRAVALISNMDLNPLLKPKAK